MFVFVRFFFCGISRFLLVAILVSCFLGVRERDGFWRRIGVAVEYRVGFESLVFLDDFVLGIWVCLFVKLYDNRVVVRLD